MCYNKSKHHTIIAMTKHSVNYRRNQSSNQPSLLESCNASPLQVKSLIYSEEKSVYKLCSLFLLSYQSQPLIPPRLNQMSMPVVMLLSLFSAMTLGGAARDRPPAIFVFGDSHVDSGNNNYLLTTLSKADHFPNGIDFKASGGMPTGRFTNGRTIADIIGEEVGQLNYAPPFLDPYTTGAALLNGVNYASGAGGILNKTGALYVSRLGMDLQIDYFKSTRQQLDEFLGKTEARELVHNAIFSITIGANDFLNNYLTFISDFEAPDTYINRLMIALEQQLTRLYYLDARKIVMGSIVPIGCIPYQTSLAPVDETGCAALPNQLAIKYNGQLRELLSELNQILPGSNFLYANLYDLFMDVITNHQSYGFETASDACCGNGGIHGGMVACGPASSLCGDRSKYVYWDPYHPTEAANLIVAKKLVHGDATNILPINIQQLINISNITS